MAPREVVFISDRPILFDLLFSFRKGVVPLYPGNVCGDGGIFFLGRQCKAAVWPISLYLVLQIYLLASWWSWWNGGSFGLRSFIDLYGIMALPLAAMVEKPWKSRRPITISFAAFLLFLLLYEPVSNLSVYQGLYSPHRNDQERRTCTIFSNSNPMGFLADVFHP